MNPTAHASIFHWPWSSNLQTHSDLDEDSGDATDPAYFPADKGITRQFTPGLQSTSTPTYHFASTKRYTDPFEGWGWDDQGTAGDDTLDSRISGTHMGYAGNDLIYGGDDSDVINGGEGADTMVGGGGRNWYVVDNLGDVIVDDAIWAVSSFIDYTLPDRAQILQLWGGAVVGIGNDSDNVISGSVENNFLYGLDGDDVLQEYFDPTHVEYGGDDTLDGGLGRDTMMGGDGNDIYIVDNAGDVVIEDANAGTDAVRSSIDYSLPDNVENLLLTNNALRATGNSLNNHITGNSADNTLVGGAGNDVLDGQGGADSMLGGTGNDLYMVDAPLDKVVEMFGQGIDTVSASVNYTLNANIENLILTGSANQGYGNGLDNTLTANDLGNLLKGGSGNDILLGGAGRDTLHGGTGQDAMLGGAGDDIYYIDDAGDVASEGVNQGADLVIASITYTLGANLEYLTLSGTDAINGTGNALNNVLKGNSAANTLSGGLGQDNLTGGAGNDTYIFARGDGQDSILEEDATTDNADTLLLQGVNHDQLWFRKSGSDLVISVIGTSDKVTFKKWYDGSAFHVERIQSADGYTLMDTNVDRLVQAMSFISAPASGQITLSASYRDKLEAVIVANWH